MNEMGRRERFRLAGLTRPTSRTTDPPVNVPPAPDDDEIVVKVVVNTAREFIQAGKPYSLDEVAPHLHERIRSQLEEPDGRSEERHRSNPFPRSTRGSFNGADICLYGPFFER